MYCYYKESRKTRLGDDWGDGERVHSDGENDDWPGKIEDRTSKHDDRMSRRGKKVRARRKRKSLMIVHALLVTRRGDENAYRRLGVAVIQRDNLSAGNHCSVI